MKKLLISLLFSIVLVPCFSVPLDELMYIENDGNRYFNDYIEFTLPDKFVVVTPDVMRQMLGNKVTKYEESADKNREFFRLLILGSSDGPRVDGDIELVVEIILPYNYGNDPIEYDSDYKAWSKRPDAERNLDLLEYVYKKDLGIDFDIYYQDIGKRTYLIMETESDNYIQKLIYTGIGKRYTPEIRLYIGYTANESLANDINEFLNSMVYKEERTR